MRRNSETARLVTSDAVAVIRSVSAGAVQDGPNVVASEQVSEEFDYVRPGLVEEVVSSGEASVQVAAHERNGLTDRTFMLRR